MKILGNVIKSQSDRRLFRGLELKNKIQCLLVSDQDAQMCSAALSVGVGSLSDPMEAQGLAHYLEHMLFMGTEKYPSENDYSNFIAKNSGHTNAYTGQQETNYHFQVATNAFAPALDRFAQFFIAPLMLESSSERQLLAVHSEHSKNLQNDMWRKYQLSKHLTKEGHPLRKFSTGDKNSLSNPELSTLLHRFYRSHYSSNLMKLVIYGNQDLDSLAKTAESLFSEIPNHEFNRFQMQEIPYEQKAMKMIYKVVPVQDRKTLQISWLLKNKENLYESPPGRYIGHLLGHEGKGSLLSFLIKQGLATSLSCGHHDSFHLYSEFDVTIGLTAKGVQQIERIIQYVMFYIEMLKSQTPKKWVFDQIQKLNQISFDFLEKAQGMSYVSRLAKRMQNRTVDQVLVSPFFMKKWNPAAIQDYLSELTYHNMMVFAEAKEFESECTETEPIYGTKFSRTSFSILGQQKCPVTFPDKNVFLPENLSIYPLGQKQNPEQIFKNDLIQAFWKKDHQFGLPKVVLKLKINYDGHENAREETIQTLYLGMLKEYLREFVYMGETAGVGLGIGDSSYFSFEIVFDGWRDSVKKILQPFLKKIIEFVPEDEDFLNTLKEKAQRNYSNYFLSDPFRQAYHSHIRALTHPTSSSPIQNLKHLPSISIQDLAHFGKSWKTSIFMQNFISGNIERQESMDIVKSIQSLFEKCPSLSKELIPSIRPTKLGVQCTWAIEETLKNPSQENSSLIVHFQNENPIDIRYSLLQELSLSFVKEPAFDYLRTKEQLGYIVMCLPDDHRGIIGLSFLIQSSVKSTYEMVQYVDKFLKIELVNKVQALDQSTFEEYKKALKSSKQQKDKNLQVESIRFWKQIARNQYNFKRKQEQIAMIDQISLQQLKNFINLLFYLNPKRLEMHMMSQKTKQLNMKLKKERLEKEGSQYRVMRNVEELKKKMDLYPDMYSHL